MVEYRHTDNKYSLEKVARLISYFVFSEKKRYGFESHFLRNNVVVTLNVTSNS